MHIANIFKRLLPRVVKIWDCVVKGCPCILKSRLHVIRYSTEPLPNDIKVLNALV